MMFRWKPLSSKTLQTISGIQKGIGVFPHTSIWDGIILGLYRLCYPRELGHLYTLVAQRFFVFPFHYVLTFFNCIPVDNTGTKKDQISAIVKKLQSKEKFLLLLSPKGSSGPKPWKKGFCIFAQQLHAPIYVLGLDYEKREASIIEQPLHLHSALMIDPKFQFQVFTPQEVASSSAQFEFHDLNQLKLTLLNKFSQFPALYPLSEPECYRVKEKTIQSH